MSEPLFESEFEAESLKSRAARELETMIQNMPFDPKLPKRPWTVSFYSFRGGVGRTTLAISTAVNLRRNAYPSRESAIVCLLDLDLEAPGISEFIGFGPPAHRATAANDLAWFTGLSDPTLSHAGLAEYIDSCWDSDDAPPIDEYVYQSLIEGVFVMPAGRQDEHYDQVLDRLDWSTIYRFCDGKNLLSNMRAGLYERFGCQYLVVDSRTGLSHSGGVAIGQLADAVVLVFQPTLAHARGLKKMVARIREREQKEERKIPRLYLASRVHCVHEDELDNTSVHIAERIIQLCEGEEVEIGDIDEDPHGTRWWPDLPTVSLAYIKERQRVRNSWLPDNFMVTTDRSDPYSSPSDLENGYLNIAEWVRQAEFDARRHAYAKSTR